MKNCRINVEKILDCERFQQSALKFRNKRKYYLAKIHKVKRSINISDLVSYVCIAHVSKQSLMCAYTTTSFINLNGLSTLTADFNS